MNLTFLKQPYPPPKGSQRDLTISLLFGLFVACFLLFFEPFDLNILRYDNKTIVITFFGVITGVIMLFFFYILPKAVPLFFKEDHWSVAKHILYYFLVLFIISTCNGLYINFTNELNFSWSNYGFIIVRTYAIGALPISLFTLYDYNQKLNFYLNEAKDFNKNPDFKRLSEHEFILLEGKHKIELKNEGFLYIKADGNYLRIFTVDDESLTSKMYRATLNEVMQQVQKPFIERCHRSYIVNLDKVISVSGNAQGLKLTIEGTADQIPVSRKYIPKIKTSMAN